MSDQALDNLSRCPWPKQDRHSTAFVRARKQRQVRYIPWQRKLALTANPEHAHAAADITSKWIALTRCDC
jgi:hypothetical protein